MTTKTIHGNSQFQKPSSLRWTWESPSGGERNPRTTINWDLFAMLAGFWEDSAMDNIDEEYNRGGEKHPPCPSRLHQSQDEDDCSRGSPVRSRQNKTRTPEQPSASTHQHPGEALSRYLSECKVPKKRKTSKTVLL
ncbi:hypothetical protein RB195_023070 [Necator americanus]|uniref:Uncharacterized protein n=1 Tax=Necator americanus TaxID=51031 RepID=A0ABR1EHR4_NECAM